MITKGEQATTDPIVVTNKSPITPGLLISLEVLGDSECPPWQPHTIPYPGYKGYRKPKIITRPI
jgi:hypothetical protein